MDKYKSEWDNVENSSYITHSGTAISTEGATAILNISDKKIKELEAKNKQLENNLAIENKSATYHCKENQRKNDVVYELKTKNKQQEKLLIEACEELIDLNHLLETATGEAGTNAEIFLSKNEIKELLERNEKDREK